MGQRAGGGGAGGLPAHGAGAHYTGGAHGQLGGPDIPPRHHQIAEALGAVAAVGNGVQTGEAADLGGDASLGGKAPRHVLVHGPAAVSHRVVKDPVGQDVVGVQHILSGEAAALPGAGQIAHPYQLVVLRPVVPAVLDVVPYAIDRFV